MELPQHCFARTVGLTCVFLVTDSCTAGNLVRLRCSRTCACTLLNPLDNHPPPAEHLNYPHPPPTRVLRPAQPSKESASDWLGACQVYKSTLSLHPACHCILLAIAYGLNPACGCVLFFTASCLWLHLACGCVLFFTASCLSLHLACGCILFFTASCLWLHLACGCILLVTAAFSHRVTMLFTACLFCSP